MSTDLKMWNSIDSQIRPPLSAFSFDLRPMRHHPLAVAIRALTRVFLKS